MDYENEEDDFFEQAQRRAKRNFLREEILDVGFSGSLFTAFCEKERGSDIDLWTFEELQDCVRRFKAKVTEEELREKPKAEDERREEVGKTQSIPISHTKRDPSPPVVDTTVRPKLIAVQSSPLDSPKEPPKSSSKDYAKTAYRPPNYDFQAVSKDAPKSMIIIPPKKAESPKVPEKPNVILPEIVVPITAKTAIVPEIPPPKPPLLPEVTTPQTPPEPLQSKPVTEPLQSKPVSEPLQSKPVTEPLQCKPVSELLPMKQLLDITPPTKPTQPSEDIPMKSIQSAEVPILMRPEGKASYDRPQVSMAFLHTDGPETLLPSADYSIPGYSLPGTELSDQSGMIRVFLENHEIVPGGLLSSSYVAYGVRTEPLGWNVKRRFNDFYWLRGVLQLQFPGYYIPPIPKKQNTGRLADETILKRRRFLSRFMDSIVKTPIFLRSTYLVTFLSESSIDNAKKSSSKLRKPERLEDFNTLDGSSLCSESLATEFMQQSNDYLSYAEILKKKLKKQSMALMEAIRTVSQQIEAIADTYRSLADLKDTVTSSPVSTEVFTAYASALMDWSTCEMRLGEAVYEHFDTFYKFRYQEMGVLKEVLRDRDLHLAVFLKAEERLLARKEKLWSQGDPGKWELDSDSHLDPKILAGNKELAMTHMLPKETAVVTKAKDLFAYYNHQALCEVRRVVMESIEVEKVNALEFAQHHSSFLRDLQVNWESLMRTLSKSG